MRPRLPFPTLPRLALAAALPARWKLALAVLLAAPLLAGIYLHRFQTGIDELAAQAQQRLALLSASLDGELLRNESLPTVLAPHPLLKDVLLGHGGPDAPARANALLAEVRERTGTGVIYLIAPSGITLAASNWREPESFVGENYGYRPYFRDALAGRTGMFFAVGATTRIPGFFIAQPVRDGERVIGVLAIKVELTGLENTWAESGEALLVVDGHGVVALSSRPQWKFATLGPLGAPSRTTLAATRQYYTASLQPLPLRWDGGQRLTLAGRDYAVGVRALRWADWRMLMLVDTAPAATAARAQALAVALALCLAAIGGLFWVQRARRLRERLAVQAMLEDTVARRTADLAAANARLREEVAERTAAEDKLHSAQRALIEANRLAALGQMAAGVAHELNQPLQALRGFAGNSLVFLERGRLEPLTDNLRQINELVERMARLTAQLKVFASRQQSAAGSAPAAATLARVAGWFAPRLEAAAIRLVQEVNVERLPLDPQALEQVASNLLGNAIDALAGRDGGGQIDVRAGEDEQGCWLEVADNGPGIAPALREKVAQPFFSTKPLGHGLGLGLAIVGDLIEASGGSLDIGASDAGGARIRAYWARPATRA